MDGVLNIDKPAGITSHDVVDRVRRIFGVRRVGHAGSLDPIATGVLLVCVGKATRIVEFLMDAEKEYEGVMTLGVTTDTEDSSGRVLSETDSCHVTRQQILDTLPAFIGDIMQTPPMVSALHHEGKRLYELARQGETAPREPRPVTVKEIELLDFEEGEHPQARLRVVCSKGLYVRTLFADIGDALGVGAHMSALRRTRIGRFVIDESVNLGSLASSAGNAHTVMMSMSDALSDMPEVKVSGKTLDNVIHGRAIWAPTDVELGVVVRVLADGDLIALAKVEGSDNERILQPDKVFI